MKQYSSKALTAALNQMDWSTTLQCTSVEEAWTTFKLSFLTVLDSIAPTRTVRVRARTEPWMRGEILTAIKQRNKTYSGYNKNKNYEIICSSAGQSVYMKIFLMCRVAIFEEKKIKVVHLIIVICTIFRICCKNTTKILQDPS